MEKIIAFILKKIPFFSRRFDPHMQEVVIGASTAMTLRLFTAGLGLCLNLLLARTFGAGGSGLYFLALTVPMIATTFAGMGLSNSLLRFISANAAIENWKAVKGVYSKVMQRALFASILLTLILFPLSSWICDRIFHKPDLAGPLRLSIFALPPLVFIGLQAQALRGLKRIQDWILVSTVGTSFFTLIGLFLVKGKFGVKGATGAYLVAVLLTSGIGYWLWKKATFHVRKTAGQFDTKELLRSSNPFFGMTLLDAITAWISILFLGIWASKAEVGIFGTASRLSTVVSMVLMAVNSISSPKFAALYKKNEMDVLGSITRQTVKFTTLLALPIAVVLILFAGPILGYFGREFISGSLILVILVAGQLVNVATGSVGALLMMTGHEKLLRNRALFMSVFSLLINVLLIPTWGILGAAIAHSSCLALTNLIAVYLVRAKLGFWTIPFIPKGLFSDKT